MGRPGSARGSARRLAVTSVVLTLVAALASSAGHAAPGLPVRTSPAAGTAPTGESFPGGGPPAAPVSPVDPADPAVLPPGAPGPAAADPAARLAAVAAVGEIAGRAGGTVHLVVRDAAGAEVVASPGAARPVWTASLVKLLVVQQLLVRRAAGRVILSAADLSRMQRAITSSDDAAMSLLWDRFDGADLVTAAVAEFGLTGTAPPDVPGEWGESVTTAQDTAGFLSALDAHLAPQDLATLTGWMRSTTGLAADGFDQRFGLLSPAVSTGTPVAAKQGWMCCVARRRQLHSAGTLADGRTVVLLGDFPLRTSWARARAALDEAAAVVTATS
jgi:hypothetical protein